MSTDRNLTEQTLSGDLNTSIPHTQEPWGPGTTVYISAKASEKFGPDFAYPQGHSQALCEANVRRIAACVNACTGVPTEQLESSPGYKAAIAGFHEQRALLVQARNQRDKLLQTLKGVLQWVDDWCETGPGMDFERVEQQANEAIATVDAIRLTIQALYSIQAGNVCGAEILIITASGREYEVNGKIGQPGIKSKFFKYVDAPLKAILLKTPSTYVTIDGVDW